MEDSTYQKAIHAFVHDEPGSLTVEAKAGSGKTTTMVKAAKLLDPKQSITMLAFNVTIKDELQQRMADAPYVKVKTFHAVGLGAIRYFDSSIIVDDKGNKCRDIYRGLPDSDPEIESQVLRLVSFAKTMPFENPNMVAIAAIVDVVLDADKLDNAIAFAAQVLRLSNRNTQLIDFDDMVYLPAIGKFPVYRSDALVIDERQDMNLAQIALIKRMMKSTSRAIAVGDRNQSIYGFRGANTEAMDEFTSAIGATELPLSICYRCDKEIIKLAQQIVPEIEWRPGAGDGIVDTLGESKIADVIQYGDSILCRTNAPLVKTALSLISRGKKAYVRGRDIGRNLLTLIKKVQRKYVVNNLPDLMRAIVEYKDAEVTKLIIAEKPGPASTLSDQTETLIALSEGARTIEDLMKNIETIFADNSVGIVCSSIHKAKGTENDRIFLLHPELLPHPMAKTLKQRQQEMNLKYVAITRAKHHLTFIQ